MPIGDPITDPIPAVGSSGTSYATKIFNFLTEVKTRLESAVPLSSLLAELLDMANNAIANASYVSLYEQTSVPTTPVGSLQNYGGELYYVSPDGAVKITNEGTLDVTAAGGIGGDYGTGPEAFVYDTADTEYYAYSDTDATPDEWAYIGARGFDVYGNVDSTTRARITWTSGTSYTITLPDEAPGSIAIVQMQDDGVLVADPSLEVVAADYKFTETRTLALSLANAQDVAGAHSLTAGYCQLGNSTGKVYVSIPIELGSRITGFHCYAEKNSDNTNALNVELFYVDPTLGPSLVTIGSASNSSNAPGVVAISNTGLAHDVTTSGRSYFISVNQTDSSPSAGDHIATFEILYIRPAS
jgi:hypothetical protein